MVASVLWGCFELRKGVSLFLIRPFSDCSLVAICPSCPSRPNTHPSAFSRVACDISSPLYKINAKRMFGSRVPGGLNHECTRRPPAKAQRSSLGVISESACAEVPTTSLAPAQRPADDFIWPSFSGARNRDTLAGHCRRRCAGPNVLGRSFSSFLHQRSSEPYP